MSTIFLSHSSRDNEAAAAMQRWLSEQGHTSLFLDFDPEQGIPAGSNWEQALYRRMRQCQAMVALVTPDWLTSKWCFAEVIQAREKGKAIFPVRIAPCDLDSIFADIQQVDLTSDREEGLRRLAAGLKDRGLDPRNTFEWDPAHPPYPGMMAFAEKDAAVFFGRSDEILQACETLEHLRRLGREAPRFLLVLGASGSGKSSLVRAGLIPRLKKAPADWLPLPPFRPQEDPLGELSLALAYAFADFGRAYAWQEIRAGLEEAANREPADGRALLDLARELGIVARRREATVLFTIDQAEELFGPQAAAARPFLRLLRAALETSDRQFLVLGTMRSDSLGALQADPALHDPVYPRDLAYEPFLVGPMPVTRFAEVIEGPARVAGLRLEDGLVHELLRDAGTGDALPLLAFTLRRLYERRGTDGVLEVREYEALGRLERAVREEANRITEGSAKEELNTLRSAFVPGMVQVNEDGSYARRRALWDDLPEQAKPLLDRFVAARLLVKDRDKRGRQTVEVAHEALLRTWPRLAEWLKDDQWKLRLLDGLRRAAQEWDEAGRKKQLLVHRRGRLRDAEMVNRQPAFALPKRSLDREYLDACIWARSRSRIVVSLAITAVFIGLSGFSVWARYQQGISDERLALIVEENSKRLVREAQVQADGGRPDLGVLLALAALPRDRNEPDRSLLTRAVDALSSPFDHLLVQVASRRSRDGSKRLSFARASDALWYSLIRQPSPTYTLRGTKAAFSPDASRIVTLDGSVAHMWDAATGTKLLILSGHGGPVVAAAFDLEGARVVTASEDSTVRVWEAASGRELLAIHTRSGPVSMASFNSDGSRVITFSWRDDATVRLWDAATGKEIATAAKVAGRTAISPDGARVVTADDDGRARVRDAATGKPITTLLGSEVRHPFAAFSPDGSRVVTASQADSFARVWDVSEGKEVFTLQGEDGYPSFSPDGKRIVTYSQDGGGTGRAWIWNSTTGEELFAVGRTNGSVTFSADGRRMITIHPEDSTIRIWDLATKQAISVLRSATKPHSAFFSPNGDQIVIVNDELARVWGRPLGEPVAILRESHGSISAAAESTDGTRIVTASVEFFQLSGSNGGVVRVWDTARRTTIFTLGEHGKAVSSIAIDAYGARVAVADHVGVVRVWDATTGKHLFTLEGHTGPIWSVAFSPDNARILTASDDKTARVWDAITGKQLFALEGHAGPVIAAVFGLDGARILTGSADHTARLWDAASGKEIALLGRYEEGIRAVALGPEGGRVLTASNDGTARLWDAMRGEEIAIQRGGGEQVSSLALGQSSSGVRVATGSKDGTVRMWDAEMGNPLLVLQPGQGYWDAALSADFSRGLLDIRTEDGTLRATLAEGGSWEAVVSSRFNSNGTRLVTGSKDGAVRVWQVPAFANWNEVVAHAEKVVPVGLTEDERARFGVIGFTPDQPR